MSFESRTEKSPYQTLGILKNANLDEIKVAYRSLAKKYHPDNLQTGNREKFEKIQQAFEELNPKKIKPAEPEIKTTEV